MISDGEKVTIYRKRNGLSQQALADQLGVSQGCVSNWENTAIPKQILKSVKDLSRGEQCLLLRHRLGWGLHELAAEYGISHTHLIKIERGETTPTQIEDYYRWLKKMFV